MKRCPACAEEIQDDATVCRFCGRLPMRPELQAWAQQWWSLRKADRDQFWDSLSSADRTMLKVVVEANAPRRSTAATCGIVVVVLGVVMVGLVLFLVVTTSEEPSPERAEERVKHDAWFTCQGFVKDRLKAPSTAEFCRYQDAQVAVDGEKYRVVGCVDSQNSFGANIRSSFMCEVRASGDKWLLESVEIK